MRLIVILVILFPVSAIADAWLCIGEKIASISTTAEEGAVFGSVDEVSSGQKYLVSADGVKSIDKGTKIIDECVLGKLDILLCQSEYVPGRLWVMPTGEFQYATMLPVANYWVNMMVVGRCSEI